MAGILREGIDSAGGLITTGSPNVFVDNYPLVRIGDKVAPHGPGAHASATMEYGSSTVFCNGIAVCRSGDAATCGDIGNPGSSDVSAG